jgi:hypothetical protein
MYQQGVKNIPKAVDVSRTGVMDKMKALLLLYFSWLESRVDLEPWVIFTFASIKSIHDCHCLSHYAIYPFD